MAFFTQSVTWNAHFLWRFAQSAGDKIRLLWRVFLWLYIPSGVKRAFLWRLARSGGGNTPPWWLFFTDSDVNAHFYGVSHKTEGDTTPLWWLFYSRVWHFYGVLCTKRRRWYAFLMAFYTKNKTSGFKPTLSACEERRSSGMEELLLSAVGLWTAGNPRQLCSGQHTLSCRHWKVFWTHWRAHLHRCLLEKPGVWKRGRKTLPVEEPFCCKVGIVLRDSRSSMPTTSGTPSIFCCGFPCPHVWRPTASYEGLSPPWFFWNPFGCWYLFSLLEVHPV